jgi:hypothetical protein
MRHTIKGETDQDLDDIHELAKLLRDANDRNSDDEQTTRYLRMALLLTSLKRRAKVRQQRMAPKKESSQ